MPDALSLLEQEWQTYRRSTAASAALRRWHDADPAVPQADMDALLAAMQDRVDPDARDRLVYRMALRSAHDADACRVVVQTVRPGLTRVARMYHLRWGWAETASMTVTAAIERIVTYPVARLDRPAANIVRDVQHRLYRARIREDAMEARLGRRIPTSDLEAVEATAPVPSPSSELVEVIDDALRTGRLSREQGRLILRQRVLDVPTDHVAAERGQKAGTIRLHRRRAEQRLAVVTRSAHGLHPSAA